MMDPMSPEALKSRKRFTIDSLLEQRQKSLQTEPSLTTSEATEDDEENETNSNSNEMGSEKGETPDSAPELSQMSPPTTTTTTGFSSQNSLQTPQMTFINAFAKLMAANSMQNLMPPNTDYANRFRMLNLNALAPSMASFGQPHFGTKQILAPFFGNFLRNDVHQHHHHHQQQQQHQLSLANSIHPLNRLMSVSSISSARSSCSSTGGHTSGSATVRSSNIKKYRCDICEKTFSRSNTLITHKRIHTGEKPFRCEHCGRAFRQPGNLTRHRLTHTTEKPFVCSECGKAFNRASNLHTHMRTHLQMTSRLHCGICTKTFVLKTELRSHYCPGKPLIS